MVKFSILKGTVSIIYVTLHVLYTHVPLRALSGQVRTRYGFKNEKQCELR